MNLNSKQRRNAIVLTLLAAATVVGLILHRELTNPRVSGPTSIQGRATITLPPGSRHRILQGIDTSVGGITIGGSGHFVQYDIGGLAGNYVEARLRHAKDVVWRRHEENQGVEFDSALLRENGRTTLFVSFPLVSSQSASYANFFAQADSVEDVEDILRVLRTLKHETSHFPRTGSGTEE